MKTRFVIEDTGAGPTPWCLMQVTDDGRDCVRVLAHLRDADGSTRWAHGNICGETREACVAQVLGLLAAYVDLAKKGGGA